ncbi:MAG: restriction endonuclease subunit M [Desulfobacteraceae bacterium]|nr:MAG: restriction endonuclease subunit M [Desulfobacteraceae bacterium]
MTAPGRIIQLVETFHNNLESYKRGNYNETQVRLEFINPFFEALGWDVNNTDGYAEAYKDVIHEDAIKVGGVTKAPDYCFRVGGARKFFLEAKKPTVNIREDVSPAFQLRRYAWSAKLPLSVLTDFEEFAVYDCRVKPSKTDNASHSRIMYLRYADYLHDWDRIEAIFSKQAVLKGSFDKYAETTKAKKGTTEVDAAFLAEIERWRDLLARNIALRNPALSQRELNFAVQQTIDRIIFLRICEDRGIEPYGRFMALKNGDNTYRRLFELFDKADAKYNSGLFHFKAEKDRQSADRLTPDLSIDDKPLKDIFKNLYYPDSPYEFSVLPADILGQVYEKFLGKVISLTPSHQAKIEEKPEVRKAGGVYYTPTYIVDYIVKNTVGRLVDGKKPGPRGGVSHIRILDPACGSGSFLIGAYQFLLDWHLDQYMADGPEKWDKGKTPRLYRTIRGDWRLTTDERKRILINNIFGVDIDPQAVEVTKLSLLLKVLEGEDEQSIGKQMLLFQERVLPDLERNIKCGNSLIGPEYYGMMNDECGMMNGDDDIFRINAFDWRAEFADIMNAGGFDAVIGNPPYGAFLTKEENSYLEKKYNSYEYQANSFVLFIEKGQNLLNQTGLISYITPAVFLTQHYFKNIRKIVAQKCSIEKILLLKYKAFKDADIGDGCVFVFKKGFTVNHILEFATLKNNIDFKKIAYSKLDQKKFIENERFEFNLPFENNIFEKIYNKSENLGNLAECVMGIKPYQTGKGRPKQTKNAVANRLFDSSVKKDEDYKQYLIGKDIDRYLINPVEKRFIKYGIWLAEPRNGAPFEENKIILRQTSDRIRAVLDEEKFYNLNNIYNIKLKNSNYSHNYLLGIINSKLMIYVYQQIVPEKGRTFAEIKKVNLVKLPIRKLDFNKSEDISFNEKLIEIVASMLKLHKKFTASNSPQEKMIFKRQIEVTDHQIDQLVYQLYGLTDEEIRMVESGA